MDSREDCAMRPRSIVASCAVREPFWRIAEVAAIAALYEATVGDDEESNSRGDREDVGWNHSLPSWDTGEAIEKVGNERVEISFSRWKEYPLNF